MGAMDQRVLAMVAKDPFSRKLSSLTPWIAAP